MILKGSEWWIVLFSIQMPILDRAWHMQDHTFHHHLMRNATAVTF